MATLKEDLEEWLHGTFGLDGPCPGEIEARIPLFDGGLAVRRRGDEHLGVRFYNDSSEVEIVDVRPVTIQTWEVVE